MCKCEHEKQQRRFFSLGSEINQTTGVKSLSLLIILSYNIFYIEKQMLHDVRHDSVEKTDCMALYKYVN